MSEGTDQDYLLAKRNNGWVSPSGCFYPCAYGDHSNKAANTHLPRGSTLTLTETFSGKLEKAGWLRIQNESLVVPSHVPIGGPCPLTKPQLETIRRFLSLRGEELIVEYRFIGMPPKIDENDIPRLATPGGDGF